MDGNQDDAMQEELMNESRENDIAIIGMACRFPGADSVDAYWKLLSEGREAIRFFSDEELTNAGVSPDLLRQPNYVKAAAILDDVAGFDAPFFEIGAREAELMDPQSRLFLETAWQSLEDACLVPKHFDGPIGLFAGSSISSYMFTQLYPRLLSDQGLTSDASAKLQMLAGNDKDFLATRVSYKLNLTGPSMTIQTACSTSLVAVHQACQSLLNGECDAALAGGVSIQVPQVTGYLHQPGMVFSADGHCRAFDAQASGMVTGSGVGVVVLRRLEDALAQGDPIRAVIRGSAVNNDGSDKVGYTAPSVVGQAAVIAEALAVAELEPESITYVEAHGTGTPMGDPIELQALTQVFDGGEQPLPRNSVALGSVKTNFGHLDSAAGIAGLIKTVLALQHQQLPPSLNFHQANPELGLEQSPFRVNTQLTRWQSGESPCRAGVSSFGIGGTNAHVIVEQAPVVSAANDEATQHDQWHLLWLSAKSRGALADQAKQLVEYLRENPQTKLADLVHSLAVGRDEFGVRQTVVAQDIVGIIAGLQGVRSALNHSSSETKPLVGRAATEPQVVFLFSGQGTQYSGMAWQLYQHQATFRYWVDQCASLLRPLLSLDIRSIVFGHRWHADANQDDLDLIHQTAYTQPALFVVEYSMAQLWLSWEVEPAMMIGHSVGEYVAACIAGVLTLSDALPLLVQRGRLIQSLPQGTMLAVNLSELEVQDYVSDKVCLAAVNGPDQTVLSGPSETVEQIEQRLQEAHIPCQRLQTSHAFHSAMMEPILDAFRCCVAKVQLHEPQRPYISNVTGSVIQATQAQNPDYWVAHLRGAVRFYQGLECLFGGRTNGANWICFEMGPGAVLSQRIASQSWDGADVAVIQTLPGPRESYDAEATLISALGQYWINHPELKLDATRFPVLKQNQHAKKIALPVYPFQHQRYWVDVPQDNHGVTVHNNTASFRDDPDKWCYQLTWQQHSRLTEEVADTPNDSVWLAFYNPLVQKQRQLINALERQAEKIQAHLVKVVNQGATQGTMNESSLEGALTVQANNINNYQLLFKRLKQQGLMPTQLFHCWGLGDPNKNSVEYSFGYWQQHGFYSLLALATGYSSQGGAAAKLTVLTTDQFEVLGTESLNVENSTVMGPLKVIPQEFPQLSCQHIDIDQRTLIEVTAERLVQSILQDGNSKDRSIAYRGRYRWLPQMVHGPMETPSNEQALLSDKGIYVITGGFGHIGRSIGCLLAEHAAIEQRNVTLVLLSRRQAMDPSALDHIKELKAIGCSAEGVAHVQVLHQAVDVSDATALSQCFQTLTASGALIKGVFHAAGERLVTGITSLQPLDCARQFAPKVQAVQAIHFALEQSGCYAKLDFCLMISSLATQLGGLGLAAYTAAHCYLDSYVQRLVSENDKQSVWQVVNWDNWLTGDDQVTDGVAIQEGISSADAIRLLQRILASKLHRSLPQLYISSTDLNQRIARWVEMDFLGEQDAITETTASLHPRPLLSSQYSPPKTDVQKTLVGLWQQLLGIDEIGIEDSFFELGGDSVVSIRFLAKAAKQGVFLTTQDIFEQQTISKLVEVAKYKADKTNAPLPEQGRVSGCVKLTPIQQWFFEQHQGNRNHFNQVMLYRAPHDFSLEAAQSSLNALIDQHDALRMRFNYLADDDRWQASCVNASCVNESTAINIQKFDVMLSMQEAMVFDPLSSYPEGFPASIKSVINDLQRPINIETGPLLTMAVINIVSPTEKKGVDQKLTFLALAIHHLVVDGLSWRWLHEDFLSGYQRAVKGLPIKHQQKTHSYLAWSEFLHRRIQNLQEFDDEVNYWIHESQRDSHKLCVKAGREKNSAGAAKRVRLTFTLEQTEQLNGLARQADRQSLPDCILAILYQAIARLGLCIEQPTEPVIRFALEGHGRDMGVGSLDVSRTVGWFTSLFPLSLHSIYAQGDTGLLIDDIAKQIRQIPYQGRHYGLLRYLSTDQKVRAQLAASAKPDILFLYLGDFGRVNGDAVDEGSLPLLPVNGSGGLHQPDDDLRSHLLEVNGWQQSGCLEMEFIYPSLQLDKLTIDRLSKTCKDLLLDWAGSIGVKNDVVDPPSKFPVENEEKINQQSAEQLEDNRADDLVVMGVDLADGEIADLIAEFGDD